MSKVLIVLVFFAYIATIDAGKVYQLKNMTYPAAQFKSFCITIGGLSKNKNGNCASFIMIKFRLGFVGIAWKNVTAHVTTTKIMYTHQIAFHTPENSTGIKLILWKSARTGRSCNAMLTRSRFGPEIGARVLRMDVNMAKPTTYLEREWISARQRVICLFRNITWP